MRSFILTNKEYFKDFVTKFTFASNSIDGNSLSQEDTFTLLFNENNKKISGDATDIFEVINQKYALDYIFSNLDYKINEDFIIYLSGILCKNITDHVGYRTNKAFIKDNNIPLVSVEEIPVRIKKVIDDYNNNFKDIYEKIAFLYISFEQIKPFAICNTKLIKLLINHELLRNDLPMISIPREDVNIVNEIVNSVDIKNLAGYFKILVQRELNYIKLYFTKSYTSEKMMLLGMLAQEKYNLNLSSISLHELMNNDLATISSKHSDGTTQPQTTNSSLRFATFLCKINSNYNQNKIIIDLLSVIICYLKNYKPRELNINMIKTILISSLIDHNRAPYLTPLDLLIDEVKDNIKDQYIIDAYSTYKKDVANAHNEIANLLIKILNDTDDALFNEILNKSDIHSIIIN